MISSFVPVGQTVVAKSTSRSNWPDHVFPVVDRRNRVTVVDTSQVLHKMALPQEAARFQWLPLARRIVMHFQVFRCQVKDI